MVKHIGGVFQHLMAKLAGAFFAGHTGYIGLAGRISASVEGGHIRVLGGIDVYPVQGNPRGFCGHLGKYRICALSDLRSSHGQLNRTVLI